MKRYLKIIIFVLSAALLLSGCTMRTVGQMYKLPRRSEDYNDLQSAIDSAMSGLEYSARLREKTGRLSTLQTWTEMKTRNIWCLQKAARSDPCAY